MSLMNKITQNMVKVTKMVEVLNLIQKLSYVLVTGDITATGGDVNANFAFRICTPFTRCLTHIDNEHTDTAKNLDIIMSMYNLIEYDEAYSDTFGSLW